MVTYDYVIVGAGSAGCVLADRLSASGQRVCLLEAGGRDLHPFLHIPAGWAANFNDPRFDWRYSTEPEPALKDRRILWPRGKVLGGSSAINGMIYIRGVPLDFERWAQSGADGWSWDEVLPYFRRAEKQSTHIDEMHGADGPLHVQDVRDKRSVHEAFINAMGETGIPRNPDFNGVDQAGAGYFQFTQHNGRRWSTASAYLRDARKRPNLTIVTGALATRVCFDGLRAVGVEGVRDGQSKQWDGAHIVLSGGAINSPQLLELSGIGNRDRLQDVGIPVVHHLPDVGENLQDHLFAKVVYGTHPELSINREVQGWRLVPAALKWFFTRSGPLTTGSAPVGGFWYTREGLEAPDVQYHFASGATLYNAAGKIAPMPFPAMTGVANQSRPESRGSLHISSADPTEPPVIHANYLATEEDRLTLMRGVRQVIDMFEADCMKPFVTGRVSPGPDVDTSDDDVLLDYIRGDASTTFHPCCTCSMGKVVDANLAVYGVQGLTVADASVMPFVVSGNTNAAAIMIGEKAADILLGRTADDSA
jgi:choline dehydrogenase